MKIKLRYPIRRGKSGFKSCVSHYAFVAEQLVKDHETEIDENDLNKLDDYIVSLKLMEIYNKFEARLTEEQKEQVVQDILFFCKVDHYSLCTLCNGGFYLLCIKVFK